MFLSSNISLSLLLRWSLNAFFYNRKLKRVLVFHARQMNDFNFDDLNGIRSGSVTPISSA